MQLTGLARAAAKYHGNAAFAKILAALIMRPESPTLAASNGPPRTSTLSKRALAIPQEFDQRLETKVLLHSARR